VTGALSMEALLVVPEILIVRGAPGVGKSSAARLLRRLFPAGAVIEVDLLRGMVSSVRWQDTDQHLKALSHARLLAESFLEAGYRPVVIVDTFSPKKLSAFTSSLARPYRVVSLYAEPLVLRSRIEGRPNVQFRDFETSQSVNSEIHLNRFPNEVLLDTSELDSGGVASALHRIFSRTA
jgi:hypothetical protein